jgi:hypothetical protein
MSAPKEPVWSQEDRVLVSAPCGTLHRQHRIANGPGEIIIRRFTSFRGTREAREPGIHGRDVSFYEGWSDSTISAWAHGFRARAPRAPE